LFDGRGASPGRQQRWADPADVVVAGFVAVSEVRPPRHVRCARGPTPMFGRWSTVGAPRSWGAPRSSTSSATSSRRVRW
jgi:hypothetical protein